MRVHSVCATLFNRRELSNEDLSLGSVVGFDFPSLFGPPVADGRREFLDPSVAGPQDLGAGLGVTAGRGVSLDATLSAIRT